jgi:hypothetical protein
MYMYRLSIMVVRNLLGSLPAVARLSRARRLSSYTWLIATATLAASVVCQGAVINLIDPANTNRIWAIDGQNFANGFTAYGEIGSGSGTYIDFGRVNNNGTSLNKKGSEEGVNTRDSVYDSKIVTGNWTEITVGILLANKIHYGSQDYIPFCLDANQEGGKSYLSLNEIELWYGTTSPTHNWAPWDTANGNTPRFDLYGMTKVWEMDKPGQANQINFDAVGSGKADIWVFVPTVVFDGVDPNTYVYLYSLFGDRGGMNPSYPENDGFEEWAVQHVNLPSFVPEPHEYGMIAVGGVAVVLCAQRWRKKHKAA